MNNLRKIILSAMVAGVLVGAAVSANADSKDGKAYSHFRKNEQHGRWRGDHGRRDGYYGHGRDRYGRYDRHHYRRDVRHDNRGDGYYGRGRDHYGRYDRHNYRHDVRHDNRGHHNKPEIRQDFKDIRNARNEVKQGRRELPGIIRS
jgi:hypothetical protein